jgi:hypothetical protein
MVRITAQLIDTATDTHRWSASYDRPLTAEILFAIQGEIATEIVAALGSTLQLQNPTRGATYLNMGYFGRAQRDFERTMVRGQSSYIGQFVLAYAARGQSAAALFLMTSRYNHRGDDQTWRLEPDYRYLTDPGYSPRQYRADVESSYAAAFGREAPPDLPDLARWPEPSERPGGGQFELFFLWNPFSPALRRAELREENRAVRDRWFRAAGLYDYWRAHEFPDRCRPVGRDDFACD